MPLSSYGVLKARAVDRLREGSSDDSPHFQIHVVDDDGTSYRIAVNVLSQLAPSELLYLAVDDFRHPLTALLPGAAAWTPLPSMPGAANLDFIRGNLFDPAMMRPLPPDVVGPDNDLADRLDHYTERAIGDADATCTPSASVGVPRATRGQDLRLPARQRCPRHPHEPGQQRAVPQRRRRVAGRRAAAALPRRGSWVAIFLAFQSQAWHTDDTTGHAIEGAPPRPTPGSDVVPVRIVAALVNPLGPAPEARDRHLAQRLGDAGRPRRLAPGRQDEAHVRRSFRRARGRAPA